MLLSKRCTTFSLVIIIQFLSWAEDTSYIIQFNEPEAAGLSYSYKAKSTNTQELYALHNGKELKQNTFYFEINLDGVVTVEELKAQARELSLRVKVLTVKTKPQAQPAALFKEGEVITIIKDGNGPKFLKNGKLLGPRVTKVLKNFFSPLSDTTDNDIFGSNTPKKVGEVWDINEKPLLSEIKKEFGELQNLSAKGKTSLIKTLKIDDENCIKVTSEIETTGMPCPAPMPKGSTLEKSFMKNLFTFELPINSKLGVLNYKMEQNGSFLNKVKRKDIEAFVNVLIKVKATSEKTVRYINSK